MFQHSYILAYYAIFVNTWLWLYVALDQFTITNGALACFALAVVALAFVYGHAAPSGGCGRSNINSWVISCNAAFTAGLASLCSLSFSSKCGYSSM